MKRRGSWVDYLVRFLLLVIGAAAWAMIAHAEVPASPTPLSMEEAIRRAVQTHLTMHLARAATQEARGQVIQTAAFLLPQITGSVSQSRTFKTNLAAQGFPASSFIPNPVIGPYNTFDARFELVQKILDVNSIWNTRSASANARAVRFQEDLAAEQVASAAALAYIEDVRALRNVQAAQANLGLAQRLSELAHHQHDAGVATGVDVARADTSVAQNRQALIQAKLAATQADIRLKRVLGMAFAATILLPETNMHVPSGIPQDISVIAQAQTDRVELRIANEQVQAESYALGAARAGHLPTLSAAADYGFSGNTPEGTARTGRIGGRLELPIFSGGSIRGQVVERKGRLLAAESGLADMRVQVEEDVRLALTTLSAEIDEVETATTQVTLAERELKLAEDRYRAGVGDNIQVVTAQTSLADARKSHVDARARCSDAQANLAMALGHMRTFSL